MVLFRVEENFDVATIQRCAASVKGPERTSLACSSKNMTQPLQHLATWHLQIATHDACRAVRPFCCIAMEQVAATRMHFDFADFADTGARCNPAIVQ